MPSEMGEPGRSGWAGQGSASAHSSTTERARRERLARILGASRLPAAEGDSGAAVPASPGSSRAGVPSADARAFIRAESEDDDGYDPYSDRPAPGDPLYEDDPWG